MGNALVAGLIVAAIAGITFIAFKDPPVYETVNRLIAVIIMAALIGGAFWNLGVQKTFKVLMPYVAPNQQARAFDAAEALQLPPWYLLVAVGISCYCVFLPVLLRATRRSRKSD